MDFTEYSDLAETGHTSKEPTKPEDEFFHSLYIAGQMRTNHAQVQEMPGKLQIRGVEYNLSEVYFIITHTKEILAKIVEQNKQQRIECFSYKDGQPPWFGTTPLPNGSPRPCPMNSNERSLNEFCNPCRSQIIVAGIRCNEEGQPIMVDNKPVFVFIRGKGMKYSNVSNYLSDLYKMDLPPIFTPPTDESKAFEKQVVNHKRFVTKISVGTAPSRYGDKMVFIMETGAKVPDETVKGLLKIAKKTKDKFKEKFDWSTGRTASTYAPSEGGQKKPDEVMTIGDDEEPDNEPQQQQEAAPPPESKPFSFDDINLDEV
jgi:hypothetical protein